MPLLCSVFFHVTENDDKYTGLFQIVFTVNGMDGILDFLKRGQQDLRQNCNDRNLRVKFLMRVLRTANLISLTFPFFLPLLFCIVFMLFPKHLSRF